MRERVVALYEDFGTAQRVVEDAGYLRDNISLVANDAAGEYAQYVQCVGEDVTAGEGAGFGAVVSTLTGLCGINSGCWSGGGTVPMGRKQSWDVGRFQRRDS